MHQELESPFLAAAIACFNRLSECPELKNYRIYQTPGESSYPSVKKESALAEHNPRSIQPARTRSEKWILVVSAKRLGQGRPLAVNVRISR